MLLLSASLAAPVDPALYTWVTEVEGRSQLVLAMELGPGAKLDPTHTYVFEVSREGARAGRVQCAPIAQGLRCRVEPTGGTCPSCATVLDVPLDGESSVPGVRAFVGRRTTTQRTTALVLQVDSERFFGADGLFDVVGRIEEVAW